MVVPPHNRIIVCPRRKMRGAAARAMVRVGVGLKNARGLTTRMRVRWSAARRTAARKRCQSRARRHLISVESLGLLPRDSKPCTVSVAVLGEILA